MQLIDYADGVQGHYCIGERLEIGSIYWKFWNDDVNDWSSAGTVYENKDVAMDKLKKLEIANCGFSRLFQAI
jgi:hypothetical protein